MSSIHDPRDVELYIAGVKVKDSFGEGNIEIERTNDILAPKVGFQGDLHLELSMDKTGTITLPIKAGSTWDTALTELQGLTEAGLDSALFPISYRNKKSNKMIASVAWVQTQAGVSEGASRDDRSFVIGVGDVSMSTVDKANDIVSQLQSWISPEL